MTTTAAVRRRTSLYHPGNRGGWKMGCGVAAVLFLAVVIGLGIWAAMSWKGWLAGTMKLGADAMLQQANLPQEQKDRILARVDALGDDFKNGKMTGDEFGKVVEAITTGPFIQLAMLVGAEKAFINPSALQDAEKDAARRSIQRVHRGLQEGLIMPDQSKPLIDQMMMTNANGQQQMKQVMTPEELEAFIQTAKGIADGASIPDEAYQVDLAAELDKAVEKALGRKP